MKIRKLEELPRGEDGLLMGSRSHGTISALATKNKGLPTYPIERLVWLDRELVRQSLYTLGELVPRSLSYPVQPAMRVVSMRLTPRNGIYLNCLLQRIEITSLTNEWGEAQAEESK